MSGEEFEIIRSLFAPLALSPGAFALTDDAALIPNGAYIVTKDLMIADVHFPANDPIDLVARKLLRVNLSDLAAKGARPIGYFLGCVWPAKTTRASIAKFVDGLKADQEKFAISLFGGDTTRHTNPAAPLTLSVTAFGAPAKLGMVRRTGAAIGDDVWVTGSIGDAGLGLAVAQKRETFEKPDRDFLLSRLRLPEPRVVFGGALSGLASSAIDVSDGLLADAGHLARAAGAAVAIEAARLPLSEAAARWVREAPEGELSRRAALAGFGDDYEILFTAPSTHRRSVEMAGKASKTAVARIGLVQRGAGVEFLGPNGAKAPIVISGYDHFSR